jgi:microcystin-dependent protein
MPYEPILGQIMPFGGVVVPRGWAPCNGQLLAINQYTALFSLLGTYYGGNGTTTFGLPDLRGRAILGSTGGGGTYPVGMISGTTTVTLISAQLPQHTHTLQASSVKGAGRGTTPPAGHLFGENTEPPAAPKMIFAAPSSKDTALQVGTNIGPMGGGVPHNNLQPYLVISYLIALNGIYPSRN